MSSPFAPFQLAALTLAVVLFSPGAKSQSLGNCPGVDQIEGDLKQSSSSGYFIPGLRLIILNRAVLDAYALPVQKFIFAHECAHSDPAVGQDEAAADCAAAKLGRHEGWLGRSEIIQVCVHLGRMPSDATHPPIAGRCANIRRCAEEDSDRSQVANDVPATPLSHKIQPQ
jgi:hypothetical protein